MLTYLQNINKPKKTMHLNKKQTFDYGYNGKKIVKQILDYTPPPFFKIIQNEEHHNNNIDLKYQIKTAYL